jgi:outer membrane cobalamin receptor
MDARNTSAGEYHNKFLVYRSRHNLNLTLNLKWNYLSFAFDYRSFSRQFSDEANSSDFEIKPYSISNLTFRFNQQYNKWQPTFTFQIRNIFDENYQIIRMYPLPGREFRISLEMVYH